MMTFPRITSTILNSSINDSVSLDNYQRVDFLKYPWKKLWHFEKSKLLDNIIFDKVMGLFQKRYDCQDQKTFIKVWNEIGAKVWTPSSQLTMGRLRAIDNAFKERFIYHGRGLEAPVRDNETDVRIQNVVHALMHGGVLSKEILCNQTFQAILLKTNNTFLKDFRVELQRELNHLALNPPKNHKEEVMWRAFFGNLISLLPFSYPPNGIETIKIPLLKDGKSRLVEYSIEVIPLSFTSWTTAMTAVGLVPKNPEDQAPCMLTYLGTTYPSGDGFIATLLADFTPGHSVGELVYSLNQSAISKWIENKKDVHLMGMSLGGAMAMHTLKHHPSSISRIDVYNPPGLYAWNDLQIGTCNINIYTQPGDIVSQLGFWPEGDNVKLYTILPHQEGISEDFINSHARAFLGCEKTTIIKRYPVEENRLFFRKILTHLHKFIGPFIVFIPLSLAILFYQACLSFIRRIANCFACSMKRIPL